MSIVQVAIIVDITAGQFFDNTNLVWVPARTLVTGFADQPTAVAFMGNAANAQYFTAGHIYALPMFYHI